MCGDVVGLYEHTLSEWPSWETEHILVVLPLSVVVVKSTFVDLYPSRPPMVYRSNTEVIWRYINHRVWTCGAARTFGVQAHQNPHVSLAWTASSFLPSCWTKWERSFSSLALITLALRWDIIQWGIVEDDDLLEAKPRELNCPSPRIAIQTTWHLVLMITSIKINGTCKKLTNLMMKWWCLL